MADNGAQPKQALPWGTVPADAVIAGLSQQIAAQATEMAAMRAYIDQLHQALAQVTEVEASTG